MTQIDAQSDSLPGPALAARYANGPTWRAWLVLWVAVAVCELVLLMGNGRVDTYLWCATRWAAGDVEKPNYNWVEYQKVHAADASAEFYKRVTPPLKSTFYAKTERLWVVLKGFGEAWMTLIVVCLIGVYDRRRWLAAVGAVVATGLAGGLGALIRMVDGRFRPTHTDGENVWEFMRGFHNGTDLSFPSGHATLAFATAGVLSYLSPRGRAVFVAVAVGCAASRVVMQAHFWSDAVFGAALGWTVGWWVIRVGDEVAERWGRA